MKSILSIILLLLLLFSIVQLVMGNIDLSLFAFPVNIALLLLLLGTTYVLYKEKKESKMVKAFMSSTTSVILIALAFLGSLVIAFAPQLQFQQSWFFNVVIVLLLCNLQLTIMRYRGNHRKRFYITHAGLFIFVVGLSFGAPDTHRLRAILYEGQTTEKALDFEGKTHSIGFPLKLERFDISYYDNKTPRSFIATISNGNDKHVITVNHPWSRSWKEDVYLVSHGTDTLSKRAYCILEFIIQPWKYVVHIGLIITAIGAIMMICGKKINQNNL